MKVLVTGGAGYVGSHVARALLDAGHEVAVFDNLSEGHRRAARGCAFIKGDLLNARALDRAFARFPAEAVIHMAAKCLVGESVERPGFYWQQNVAGSLALLEAMGRAGAKLVVFSSSAAVYGQPTSSAKASESSEAGGQRRSDRDLIDEAAPKAPCNPYGTTKLVFEHALADHSAAGLVRYVALRYFNAAGAHSSGRIGEDHPVETHLIPNLLTAALSGGAKPLKIFGTDYPTPDGTAVRDYVHVEDLARAHVKALEYLASGGASIAINLGTGRGSSILEVLAAAKKVTGRDFPTENAPRRAGDPARLVASNALALEKLGWKPERSIEDIIASAWKWHSRHPQGYGAR